MKKSTKEDEEGNVVEFWVCERAQISASEYEEYKKNEAIFSMPDFLEMKEQIEEQGLMMAETSLNAEYLTCLQELSI